jgi:hypothetical protein
MLWQRMAVLFTSIRRTALSAGMLLVLCGSRVPAAQPPATRAANLKVLATGLGMSMTMSDYLESFPNGRTSIFAYLKLDGNEVESMLRSLEIQADKQERAGREFWPQIALETHHLTLAEFRHELAQPDSLVERNVRLLARAIARYRDGQKWFFIRPFCEMNDGTPSCPWEFAHPSRTNTPGEFASAWRLLRRTFEEEGATNAIFIFSPLAAYRVHHEKEVLAALNMIPPGEIDAYGLNLYSRPLTAYGGKSPEPIPFSTLAQPWLDLLARSRHRGIPLAVPEMGVSNQASDAQRANWLRAAFRYARTHHFVLFTYFNFPHPYWQIDDRTLAGEALRAGINDGPPVVPRTVAAQPAPSPRQRPRDSRPARSDAPDLSDYRMLNPFSNAETCVRGEGLAVIIDPTLFPPGKLPYARIDRVVGRKLQPVDDRAGLYEIRRGGDNGGEIVESAWLKTRHLPDGRIALLWERSKEGGPQPGEYRIHYYLSASHIVSGVSSGELGSIQRLHCDDTR